RLPLPHAVRVVRQLAAALHYAHAAGVVHRDVKPANVLLDRAGDAHLADFGLAFLGDDEGERTQEGAVLGTPLYMPPEQAGGRPVQPGRAVLRAALRARPLPRAGRPGAAPGADPTPARAAVLRPRGAARAGGGLPARPGQAPPGALPRLPRPGRGAGRLVV